MPNSWLLGQLSLPQRLWMSRALRDETVGGAVLLVAAAVAVVWANSPWAGAYESLIDIRVGPQALHLNLTLSQWAADGLLAVFFFVVGLELKHELVLGSLRKLSSALVPITAALAGMAIPALIYAAINVSMSNGYPSGWGIPMATDIAFALAVLAIGGRRLPVELRAFLLTLAVVDDLGAISVIAIFYSADINLLMLALGAAACVAYGFAQRARIRTPALYVPLALAAWMFIHASGVHATVAGIALGLLTRVRPDAAETAAPSERMLWLLHPFSANVCVPVFAFTAAGVSLLGIDVVGVINTPVALGIILGLIVGKPIGIVGGAWLIARFTKAELAPGLHWRDVSAIGVVAGIGFTVSLLVNELVFADIPGALEAGKLAILVASGLATILALAVLVHRTRRRAAHSG